MRVFIFGGSGLVGSAVTLALTRQGHQPIGLARSGRSARIIEACGGSVVMGDACRPETWLAAAGSADAIIQAAADFEAADPSVVDAQIINALLHLELDQGSARRIVYTGGCWLYPERTDPAITEQDAFDPLPAFAYMVANRQRLLDAGMDVVTVHPGIVWNESAGFLADCVAAIREGRPIEAVGSLETLWPLVHADDLAALYCAALTRGEPGANYLGITEAGRSVADIIRRAEQIAGAGCEIELLSVDDAVRLHGDWAAGRARSQRLCADVTAQALQWRPELCL